MYAELVAARGSLIARIMRKHSEMTPAPFAAAPPVNRLRLIKSRGVSAHEFLAGHSIQRLRCPRRSLELAIERHTIEALARRAYRITRNDADFFVPEPLVKGLRRSAVARVEEQEVTTV